MSLAIRTAVALLALLVNSASAAATPTVAAFNNVGGTASVSCGQTLSASGACSTTPSTSASFMPLVPFDVDVAVLLSNAISLQALEVYSWDEDNYNRDASFIGNKNIVFGTYSGPTACGGSTLTNVSFSGTNPNGVVTAAFSASTCDAKTCPTRGAFNYVGFRGGCAGQKLIAVKLTFADATASITITPAAVARTTSTGCDCDPNNCGRVTVRPSGVTLNSFQTATANASVPLSVALNTPVGLVFQLDRTGLIFVSTLTAQEFDARVGSTFAYFDPAQRVVTALDLGGSKDTMDLYRWEVCNHRPDLSMMTIIGIVVAVGVFILLVGGGVILYRRRQRAIADLHLLNTNLAPSTSGEMSQGKGSRAEQMEFGKNRRFNLEATPGNPNEPQAIPEGQSGLSQEWRDLGWGDYLDNATGLPYYYNHETGESRWELEGAPPKRQ